MVNSVGSVQNQAMDLLQQRKAQILEKLKNGDSEEAIVTGGNAFTESVWNKMLENIDDYLDEVKEEQKIRFAKIDEKQQEKERIEKRLMQEEMLDECNQKEILDTRSRGILDEAMKAIASNAKCWQMQQELDETLSSISENASSVSKNQEPYEDEVTADQIAELFRDKEL